MLVRLTTIAALLLTATPAFAKTEYTRVAIIIAKSPMRPDVNAKAKLIDTRGGEHTFSVGLCPASDPACATPVAYWCRWVMTEAHWNAVLAAYQVNVSAGTVFIYDGREGLWTPDAVLAERGCVRQEVAP